MRKTTVHGLVMLLVLLVVGSALLAACASQPAPTTAAQKFEWIYLDSSAAGANPFYPPVLDAINRVDKATNGRLKIKVMFSGELPYKAADYVSACQKNEVQMCYMSPGNSESVNDVFGVESFIGIGKDYDQIVSIAHQVKRPWMEKILSENYNIQLLAQRINYPHYIWSAKKLESLADLKGLKTRGAGSAINAMYTAFGASPVSVDVNEVYTSLQYGVIDAANTATAYAVSFGWHEVAKWGYLLPLRAAVDTVIVNKSALAQLPSDLQKIFTDEMAKIDKDMDKAGAAADQQAWDKVKAKGIKLVEPTAEDISKFLTVAAKVNTDWVNVATRSQLAKDYGKAVIGVAAK